MFKGITVMVCLAVLGPLASQAAAAGPADVRGGHTIDGSLILATEPRSGYDQKTGFGIGTLIDLSDRTNMSPKAFKVGIRGDFAYFDWEGDFSGTNLSYKRVVLFGGPRFTFLPGASAVAPYLEGGLELAYDDMEVTVPIIGKASSIWTSLGFAGGGGVDFTLARNLILGVNGRVHLVSDPIYTFGVTLGLVF